jgi:membrane associated rhomboid family serine protease
VNEPQLEVVCPNCSEHVSPYVTECPYCGARVRKRAPKLERHGDVLEARQPVRKRIREAAARRSAAAPDRPLASWALVLVPAVLLVVQRAADLSVVDVGAIAGSIDGDWWRLAAAPFVYTDVGYLFACGLAVSIFATGLERRIGTIATALLLVACGALGMLGADAAASAGIDDALVAAGGNGIALGALGAWAMLRLGEARRGGDALELVGVAVVAVALLLLPIAETTASPIAGIAGGLVGVAAGWFGARAGIGE